MSTQAFIRTAPVSCGGFTLIEVVISIAIVAMLTVVAAPALRETLLNVRMTALANDLMTDIAIARAEAVKHNVRTFLCTSNNAASCTAGAWTDGWIVVFDADNDGVLEVGESQPLKTSPAIASGNSLTVNGDTGLSNGARYIVYRPSGVSTPGTTITFDLCDVRTVTNVGASAANLRGRRIEINPTGRPIVVKRTCP